MRGSSVMMASASGGLVDSVCRNKRLACSSANRWASAKLSGRFGISVRSSATMLGA